MHIATEHPGVHVIKIQKKVMELSCLVHDGDWVEGQNYERRANGWLHTYK